MAPFSTLAGFDGIVPTHRLSVFKSLPHMMDEDEEALLAAVEDDYSRAILDRISTEPLSAPELVEAIDASKPTVYRRLSTLEELDLVAAKVDPDKEGHHRKVYVVAVDAMHVKFETEGVTISVEKSAEDAVDRFRKLVGDLS